MKIILIFLNPNYLILCLRCFFLPYETTFIQGKEENYEKNNRINACYFYSSSTHG